MVDNFDYIKSKMRFPNDRSFYFIQVLKRKKENPSQESYSRPIESFYVFDAKHLERLKPHIIDIAEKNRARAYIKMNTLDAQSVGLAAIRVLSEKIQGKDWKGMSKAFNVACGRCGMQLLEGEEKASKLYLVDLDDDMLDKVDEVRDFINTQCEPLVDKKTGEPITSKVYMEVPTKHGLHLVTTGFNKQRFGLQYPKIDVHDDGITLLYFPASADLPAPDVTDDYEPEDNE